MNEGLDGMFDLLTFILVLGACLFIGFGIMGGMTKAASQTVALDDKTMPELRGDNIVVETDGSLSRLDAILMTQVQDYNMPYPRRLTTENESGAESLRIDITSVYKLDVVGYGVMLYNELRTHPTDQKYYLEYDYGVHNVENDESYRLRRGE